MFLVENRQELSTGYRDEEPTTKHCTDLPRLVRGVALTLAMLGVGIGLASADVIIDTFDAGGGFHGANHITTARVIVGGTADSSVRRAVQFTVTGDDFTLDSITLPISLQRNVADNILRVRLTGDSGGAPGATIEVLSENEDIWPAFSNPFTTTTTLNSSANPVLSDGASYWIVTEPTSIPGSAPSTVDFGWYHNTSGVGILVRTQQVTGTGALPTDPWPGSGTMTAIALLVEGTPAAAATNTIPTLSEYGVGLFALLLAGAAVLVIRRMAV